MHLIIIYLVDFGKKFSAGHLTVLPGLIPVYSAQQSAYGGLNHISLIYQICVADAIVTSSIF